MNGKKIVTFGEILMRLSTPEFLRFQQATSFDVVYGGAESNIACSLANFGLNTSFVTRLPDNEFGRCAVQELRRWNVSTEDIVYGGGRIGLYFLEKGAMSRASMVVYDRADSAIAEIQPGDIDWEKVFEGACWFHWSGITPAISESAAIVCQEAVDVAHSKGLIVSADLNYRSKLWNYGKSPIEVIPRLVEKTNLLLANRYDAKTMLGVEVSDGDEMTVFKELGNELIQRFSAVNQVVCTFRKMISASHNQWSAALMDGNGVVSTKTYNLTHIVDRVGGGDSFMAGLIYGLNTYKNSQKSLNFATAASALKHTIQGDVNIVSIDEVEKLMGGDGSGRVDR